MRRLRNVTSGIVATAADTMAKGNVLLVLGGIFHAPIAASNGGGRPAGRIG
jgi:hypothetical protein